MLAALATLSQHEDLLHHVAPPQTFNVDDGYNGKFSFKIYQYGKWIDVIIDDRLPTRNGRLIFVQSAERNEFWSALLEKAFAKVHGSYKNLEGGHGSEAMTDLTGGICEYIEWKKGECDPAEKYPFICDALMDSALVTTAIQAQSKADMERQRTDGLVVGHAYSITGAGVYRDSGNGRKYHLVKLRNPWGACEWTGDFSDGSGRWEEYGDMREGDEDGEFWMSCADWARHFTKLEVCRIDPEDFDSQGDWQNDAVAGEWSAAAGTAGGCRNYPSFVQNPYKIVELEGGEVSDQILISLQQKHRRSQKQKGVPMLATGFEVFKLLTDDDTGNLEEMIDTRRPVYSATFVARRDYTKSLRLPDGGKYAIVASTFRPGEEGKYYLRIFTEHTKKEQQEDWQGDDDGWW